MGRIRNYSAMNEEKLIQCYVDLKRGVSGLITSSPWEEDAYSKCLYSGSTDVFRDINEIERVAEIRLIELPKKF